MARAEDTTTRRAELAVALAKVNQQLGLVSVDGNLAEFATEHQLQAFRATISRARREVQRAELDLHDLLLDPSVFSGSPA